MSRPPGSALAGAWEAWRRGDLEHAAAELGRERREDEQGLAAAIDRTCAAVEQTLGAVALHELAWPHGPAGLARAAALRRELRARHARDGRHARPARGAERAITRENLSARLRADPLDTGAVYARGWRPVLLERDALRGDLWWFFGALRLQRGALWPRGTGRAARRLAWLGLRALFPLALRARARALQARLREGRQPTPDPWLEAAQLIQSGQTREAEVSER